MSSILVQGDPRLHERSQPVRFPDPALSGQLASLHEVLRDFRARHGYGRAIAAPQVGLLKRCIALNLGATPFSLVNPEFTWLSGEMFDVWDDCLSVPDCVVRVRRHRSISIRYHDEHGRAREWRRLPPDLAELIQHEMDHLDGVLMTERALSPSDVRPISERSGLVDAGRPSPRLELGRIARASEVIDPAFLRSPQYDCAALSEALGCELTLKLEFTNPIRSFKGRGAEFFVHRALERGETRPMVCASAGNWGQALAYACRRRGLPLRVYCSMEANPLKVERMRALGAEVVQTGSDFDEAKAAARLDCQATGAWMVEDGLEPEISEGAGTIAVELLERGAAFDAMLIALGNGALLTGMGRWIKAASPATEVIGVASSGADAMERSWREGRVLEGGHAATIADGIAVRVPIPEALADMRGAVDEVLLVSDASILDAMRLLESRAGLLVEPAGAVGVAAILERPGLFAGRRVATVLCGSNLTPGQVRDWLFSKKTM